MALLDTALQGRLNGIMRENYKVFRGVIAIAMAIAIEKGSAGVEQQMKDTGKIEKEGSRCCRRRWRLNSLVFIFP